MSQALSQYIKANSSLVDQELEFLLRRHPDQPETIRKAMRYSIFAGGKRLRPVLVIAAAQCCGTSPRKVLKTAAAMEMIHTYSLIHDDLPAMDDDDLRRGKPTNHKIFGEAIAILAGDGLLTYAFEAAAINAASCGLSAGQTGDLIKTIAEGSGTRGMVGGQAADLQAEGRALKSNGSTRALLEYIHLHKTAALIIASLEAGAILGRAAPLERKALRDYGRAIGLAFQIADDVLDVVGDKKKMGKAGSDRDNLKLTYASLYGVDAARQKAQELVDLAHSRLKIFGAKAAILHDLADYIIARDK